MKVNDMKEYLGVMRRQEESLYACSDYLEKERSRPRSESVIDKLCRFKMTQWSYQVIDYIRFRRETVSVAMNYLDRFLSSGCERAKQVMKCRKEYQLASMTCLFMAIKINEPVMIDMNLLTELSKGIYTQSDFQRMETDILFGLNWLVNGPTPLSFAVHIISLMKYQQQEQQPRSVILFDYKKLLESVVYQIELSVGEYNLMMKNPSVVAIASIWNNIENSTDEIIHQQFHEVTSSIYNSLEGILDVKESLQKLQAKATIQMRPSSMNLIQNSSRSTATSSSPSSGRQSQHGVSFTKGDTKDCSPICVSKRNVSLGN
jgi:hypothetical protein